mmetsp:Transcript_5542/g.15204  ORF Transcript_5542/g.15204 Transcript_5542/m.15204 type:complete len:278 (+) Transcript_5542:17-850(+)
MAASALNRVAVAALGLGVGGFTLQQCLYTVDGGHRAVIWDRFSGVKEGVYGEGTHFRVPLIQYPTIFDVRMRPRVISSRTGTKDLQTVTISLRVLSRPVTDALPTIFRTLGEDFDERVLPSIANEVLKATVAQYDADQLLTQRETVSRAVREGLNERAHEFNLVLEDVSITHLAFGREFTRAIEQKQVAQQESERAKFVVLKAEQEKKAAIIRAEGESEAAELISDALAKSGNGLIEVRRIDAARTIAETLSRSRNVTYLPSSQGMLLNVGVGGAGR